MEYKPRPAIAQIQSFNLPEGVSSYHVRWAIGKLPVNGNVESEIFKMGNVDVGGSSKAELEFQMDCWMEEDDDWEIELCRIKGEDDPDVPIIVRLGIFNDKAGIRIIGSPVMNSSIRLCCTYYEITDDKKQTLQAVVADGFVIHCWVDIPNKVIESKQRPRDPQDGLGSALLSSGGQEVIGENGGTKRSSDITLVTDQGEKDERRFSCHAAVLSCRSPVFQAMLDGDQFEEGKKRVVKIEDIHGDAMEILLKYIYTGVGDYSNISIDANLQIVNAAEKYMLPELRDECLLALIQAEEGEEDVHDGDWINYLHVAEKFNIHYLKKICILALTSNLSFFEHVQIGGKLRQQSMTDLLVVIADRMEKTKVIKIASAQE